MGHRSFFSYRRRVTLRGHNRNLPRLAYLADLVIERATAKLWASIWKYHTTYVSMRIDRKVPFSFFFPKLHSVGYTRSPGRHRLPSLRTRAPNYVTARRI